MRKETEGGKSLLVRQKRAADRWALEYALEYKKADACCFLPISLCLKDNFVGAGYMINSVILMAGERALLIENMQLNIDFRA